MGRIPEQASIVLAEDDPDDRLLILRAANHCQFPCRIVTVQDGDELMEFLNSKGSDPSDGAPALPLLIILDLNMPRKDGREALLEIKQNPHLRSIPVIVLTTSSNPDDVSFSYHHGVNAYIVKPDRYEQLQRILASLKEYWFDTVCLPGI